MSELFGELFDALVQIADSDFMVAVTVAATGFGLWRVVKHIDTEQRKDLRDLRQEVREEFSKIYRLLIDRLPKEKEKMQ